MFLFIKKPRDYITQKQYRMNALNAKAVFLTDNLYFTGLSFFWKCLSLCPWQGIFLICPLLVMSFHRLSCESFVFLHFFNARD